MIRALSLLLDKDWDEAYLGVVTEGYRLKDMPSSNHVWGTYLKRQGYKQESLPNTCPDCYTVRDFCNEHKQGKYLLATGSHVIAVKDGDYYDTWDSGDEIPVYYFERAD